MLLTSGNKSVKLTACNKFSVALLAAYALHRHKTTCCELSVLLACLH